MRVSLIFESSCTKIEIRKVKKKYYNLHKNYSAKVIEIRFLNLVRIFFDIDKIPGCCLKPWISTLIKRKCFFFKYETLL